jgi:hypothetical protein
MVSEDGVEFLVQPRGGFGVRPECVPGRRHGSRSIHPAARFPSSPRLCRGRAPP